MRMNDCICGFEVKNITTLPEIDAVFYEMEHRATGAKLGWLQNGEDNKTFSISFCTTPEDDTGVFHILEHSVLQGSCRYPAKAPFVHLMKSSMNTFLNAMTFPDKTVFPVSSRNEKDFENLLRVYMDAVFHPIVHENENIFLQEGWHYEFDEEEGTPYCNGVVLNEMKGDHSSVDSLLSTYVTKSLFPDNCYAYEAGGDPASIVKLDYKDFCETHRKYYHPSNAYIILDGEVDIERTLRIIDEEYLREFEKKSMNIQIPLQRPVQSETEYAFAAEDEEDTSGYLGLGYVIGTYEDQKKIYAARILADYLAGSNASPIRRTILEAGLGYDVSITMMDGMLQPFVLLTVRNMDPARRKDVESAIQDELLRLKEEGLDATQLEALLCQQEFQARERDFGEDPAGVMNGVQMLETWLYGGDPVQCFRTKDTFTKLRQEIRDGSFVQYLDEIFIRNPHTASVLMNPSATLLEEEDAAEASRLEDIFGKMNAEDIDALVRKNQDLKEWQETPGTEETLRCIPVLDIEDISANPMPLNTHVLPDGTLWHREATKGICYLNLYFPLDTELLPSLSAISFLTGLYGELPLHDLDKNSLDREKNRLLGRFSAALDIMESVEGYSLRCYLRVNTSYLAEREDEALALVARILKETDFDCTDEIATILYQQQELGQQEMIMNGHSMAMMRAMSEISKKGELTDLAEGPSYIQWINNQVAALEDGETENSESDEMPSEEMNSSLEEIPVCEENSEQEEIIFCEGNQALDALQALCASLSERIISGADMMISVTGDGEETPYKGRIQQLLDSEFLGEKDAEGIEFAQTMMDSPGLHEDDDVAGEAAIADATAAGKSEALADNADGNRAYEMVNTIGINNSDDLPLPCSFLSIPAPVAYSATAGNLNSLSVENSGAWSVLAKLASMDYLWNQVRVLGGAYGTGMSISADGMVTYFSYRDPNPEESLETYASVPAFLTEFCESSPNLTGVIIGAISETDPVLTAGNRGYMADKFYLSGITDEYRALRRKQMMSTTVEELKKCAEQLEGLKPYMASCIVASPEIFDV